MRKSVLAIPLLSLWAILVAALLVSCASAPATYDEAMSAYQTRNYKAAYRAFAQVANRSGDANAEYWLGYLYERGLGTAQWYPRAREWYEKSAAQGNAAAEFALARFYLYGYWVRRDASRGLSLCRTAADKNNFDAEVELASIYWHGYFGVRQDKEQANKYFMDAASHTVSTQDEMNHALHAIVDAHKDAPPAAVKARQKGTVIVNFDYDGEALTNTYVARSSGYPLLDSALVAAVQESVFPKWAPGTKGKTNYFVAEVFTYIK